MIRQIKLSDIPGLNSLPPEDWKSDYESFLRNFISEDFFFAFIKIHEGKIVGTGNVLIKGKIGWLGNIIVDETCRGKGFGNEITQYLIHFLEEKGCKTQLLIATELGEAVYKKLGFKRLTRYVRFDSETDTNYQISDLIRKLEPIDFKQVHQLDITANDEDRSHLIEKFSENGWGYFSAANELLGFYLPNFGRGLVVSKDQSAGLELLKFKHATKGKRTLLPQENVAGIAFLEQLGLQKSELSSRMVLGNENHWKPEWIFSYGSGYCG